MMSDKKQKLAAANRSRIERLTRRLSQVGRRVACLRLQEEPGLRYDLLVEREVVLFACHRSHHMH
jgi:hypothetical protein